jgi:putative DNA primase/helicase
MMDAAALAHALGGKRSGRQFKCYCPAHDDHDPSLIVFDGHKAVQVRCLAGCEPRAVIAALRQRGLWNGTSVDEQNSTEQRLINQRRERQRVADERKVAWLRARALALFAEARPALGTAVETIYFGWWRGLTIAATERERLLTDVIRFHRCCPRKHEHAPSMVALMRNIITDRPQAIHRTFLDQRWCKDGKPMMLAPAGGAAVKLSGALPCDALFIAEGIETGLACMLRGWSPVWALGSAVAVKWFPVIDGVSELVVCADRDPHGKGQQAAAEVVRRWLQAGRRARMELPEDGKDFASGLEL